MMKTCEALRRRMFALAGCDWTGEVCFKEGEELSLLMDGERLTVEAPDISAAARGLFLAACALRDGKDIPELHQTRAYRILRHDAGYVPRRRDDGGSGQGDD